MESIEEQWSLLPTSDITSKSWASITDAKKAVKTWFLDRGESWAPSTHNNKTRLHLHCLSKTCPFHIRVAQQKDGFFGVITYTPHDCPPSTHSGFKQRNSAWYLASLVERDITINRHIKPKEIRERATIYHHLPSVPYISAWRARERLCDTLNGNEGASFKLIPTWIERVKAVQGDDFYTALQTSENGSFEALFIVFGPINLGIQTLRPFYAFDGTHTRSRYNLTLLIAVGVDAEDHVLPLAFALVPIENEKWWSWFCEHFVNAFNSGLSDHYVIMSDREKGLINAVKTTLPGAIHSMCCQHIAENIHKTFGRGFKPIFWQIARAKSNIDLERAIQDLRQEAPQVEEYLQSIGYETFAFARFPHPRFGHDTSNIVESVNSIWRDIRELPPLQLINGIYQWMLTTFYQRLHTSIDSGNTFLSNTAYRQYKHRESIARGCQVFPSSNSDFRVTTSQSVDFIVHLPSTNHFDSLIQGSCTCGKYQEYIAPCSHAIACIQYISGNPYDYFFPYYHWDVVQRLYKLSFPPVSIQGLQPSESEVLPPVKHTKRGRPKVARIRANYQAEKRIHLCSICQQPGHNRRICPNQPVSHGRAQRVRDQLVDGMYLNPIK